jgi:hypothetical protein
MGGYILTVIGVDVWSIDVSGRGRLWARWLRVATPEQGLPHSLNTAGVKNRQPEMKKLPPSSRFYDGQAE